MSTLSKNDIDKVRASFKASLLKGNHRVCYSLRSIAALLFITQIAAREVCEGLLDDIEFEKQGFKIEIERDFFKMLPLQPIERPDAPIIDTTIRDFKEACLRGRALRGR